jgi:phosphoribosyl 1,2-cyclic phosphate phosphodiesterase
LDDIRPINFLTGRSLPVFASEHTWHDLRQVFSYVFRPRAQHSLPQLVPHVLAGVFQFGALTIEPLEVIHGKMLVTAFRIATPASAIAYVTDCNEIPAATLARLTDLDLLIIDALRYREHPTHLWLDRTLQYIAQLQPRQALLTHISHDMQHALLCQELPAQVRPAYDNLTVEFP